MSFQWKGNEDYLSPFCLWYLGGVVSGSWLSSLGLSGSESGGSSGSSGVPLGSLSGFSGGDPGFSSGSGVESSGRSLPGCGPWHPPHLVSSMVWHFEQPHSSTSVCA